MRRLAAALAAGGIAVIGFAAPAQASPGLNYGHDCVRTGQVEPHLGKFGPAKINPQNKPTGALNARDASGGKSHFDDGGVCYP
ncbi:MULTISPECIES: hypothetical protein [unclassified Micromonospora]|uniref:hypothetical protein n=1 Tax=unclassified Micromonospora TaxID=2617518 RepID=UPI0033BBC96F